MSFWVHRELGNRGWSESTEFDPPLPGPVAGRGFATFCVEFNGVTFRFASLDELRVCIATLSKKLLPATRRLSAERGSGMGPNSHWLSRLPAKAKPWRYRERAARYLERALADFESEVDRTPVPRRLD
jgi:hypothetical protein